MSERIDVVGDGSYWLDPERLDLFSRKDDPARWDVDLLRCTNPAQMLDVIFHASDGGTDPRTAGLVKCLDILLRPREGMCSGGRSGKFSEREIRRRVEAFLTARNRGNTAR